MGPKLPYLNLWFIVEMWLAKVSFNKYYFERFSSQQMQLVSLVHFILTAPVHFFR